MSGRGLKSKYFYNYIFYIIMELGKVEDEKDDPFGQTINGEQK